MLPELWEIIFTLSHNKDLNILNQVSKWFNSITTTILHRRRLNYPRIGGKYNQYILGTINDNKMLKYIYHMGTDLVKGDIIISNLNIRYRYIYSGLTLIQFNLVDRQTILDKSFDILKDNVHPSYWSIFNVFHIDLDMYMAQCIGNINFGLLGDIVDCDQDFKNTYVLYTKFTKDKTYYIIAQCHVPYDKEDKIKLFKNGLIHFIGRYNKLYGINTFIMMS